MSQLKRFATLLISVSDPFLCVYHVMFNITMCIGTYRFL